MTLHGPSPYTAAADAAAALLAAHPDLPTKSLDVMDVTGLGPAALVQVPDLAALRAWSAALDTPAPITGASGYGTTDPREPGHPDWLWWRAAVMDTTATGAPVRLWALEISAQPRALAAHLAATIRPARLAPQETLHG